MIEKCHKVLEEADVEEEKRDLITREIGKFREIMKVSIKFFCMGAKPKIGLKVVFKINVRVGGFEISYKKY